MAYDVSKIKERLGRGLFSHHIEAFDCLDSTNTYVKALAAKGALEGAVVLAEEQTAGRGRMGRSFSSPKGAGVYMSVLLRPAQTAEISAMMTACTAVAVCRAVERLCNMPCGIKWVNDVLLGGKKVCGILAESTIGQSGGLSSLVLGIGINVSTGVNELPPELRDRASSLLRESGLLVCPEELVADILFHLEQIFRSFPGNRAELLDYYRERLTTLSQTVFRVGGDAEQALLALDIDESFGLVVADGAGKTQVLRSGDVSVRPVSP